MKLLIIGATGGTGKQLVRQALERGHHVVAFVRNPEKFSASNPSLTVAKGNVRDYVSAKSAMRGCDAVLCALGHKRWFYPNRILSEGTRNIVRAMNELGIRRFICTTSLSVGESFGKLGIYYTLFTIPFILPFYFWDKLRQEKIIRASSLDWTIVRPGALTNGKKLGRYKHGADVGSYLWTVRVSRADVAEFMLNQLEDAAYLRTAVGISY
jgi:putative NADH-flavin reductase